MDQGYTRFSKKVGLKNLQICGNFYFLGFYKGERSNRCEVVVERSDSCEVGVSWCESEVSWCEVGVERSDRCEVGATKWALSEMSVGLKFRDRIFSKSSNLVE